MLDWVLDGVDDVVVDTVVLRVNDLVFVTDAVEEVPGDGVMLRVGLPVPGVGHSSRGANTTTAAWSRVGNVKLVATSRRVSARMVRTRATTSSAV